LGYNSLIIVTIFKTNTCSQIAWLLFRSNRYCPSKFWNSRNRIEKSKSDASNREIRVVCKWLGPRTRRTRRRRSIPIHRNGISLRCPENDKPTVKEKPTTTMNYYFVFSIFWAWLLLTFLYVDRRFPAFTIVPEVISKCHLQWTLRNVDWKEKAVEFYTISIIVSDFIASQKISWWILFSS
jgi:hypothetical protein